MADSRGLAPDGWRVATDADWKALEKAIGIPANDIEKTGWRGDLSGKLKSMSYGGTNNEGLSIVPAGIRLTNGGYNYFAGHSAERGVFWTSTSDAESYIRRLFQAGQAGVNRSAANMKEGYSVRCVKDTASAVPDK